MPQNVLRHHALVELRLADIAELVERQTTIRGSDARHVRLETLVLLGHHVAAVSVAVQTDCNGGQCHKDADRNDPAGQTSAILGDFDNLDGFDYFLCKSSRICRIGKAQGTCDDWNDNFQDPSSP